MSSTLEAPKKPSASRTVALHEIARHHSGNGKLIKGKLHSEAAAGLYPAFSASGQDVWHTEYGYEGDAIIVSAVGARCGKCFVAQGRWSAIANTHVVWPDPERIELKYLWYLLNDEQFWIRSGSAQPFVSTKKTFEKEIPLPPLDEQRAIVAEIEKQFTRLEAGVGALKRVQDNLKRYRAAVLKSACEGKLVPTEAELAKKKPETGNLKPEFETGEQLLQRILSERRKNWTGRGKYKEPATPDTTNLPELPEGWTWATVEQLNLGNRPCAYGVLQPGDNHEGGVPFVRVGDINEGRVSQENLKHISPAIAAQYPRTKLHGGELAITLVGAIGRTAIIPQILAGGNTARAVGIVPLSLELDSHWIEIWFRNPRKIAEMLSKSHEVARKTLNLEDVRISSVALPPLSEQKRIVEEVERRLSVIDELEGTVSANLQRATRLRQSILQKAFSPGV